MSEITWIKLKTEMFSDDKIRLIESLPEADAIILIWIKLLAQAGKTNANGYIFLNEQVPFTEEMLATIFNRPLNTVRSALETLQQFRMINIDDKGFILIENWEKHQNVEGMEKIREQWRIRKQRQRENQKLLNSSKNSSDDEVTGQSQDITQQNKNKSKNKENIYTVFDFWNELQIIQHRKLTDKTEKKINSCLNDYSVEEINTAIKNYHTILESSDYYFNYRWTLAEFLQRGLEKFLDFETARNNYRTTKVSNNGHDDNFNFKPNNLN